LKATLKTQQRMIERVSQRASASEAVAGHAEGIFNEWIKTLESRIRALGGSQTDIEAVRAAYVTMLEADMAVKTQASTVTRPA
jgi:hypothetical protein